MKKMLKIWMVSLLFLLVASHNLSAFAQNEQQLNLSMLTDPTLDPALTSDTYSPALLKNIFEGLARPDENGELQPAAAESWQVNDDGTVYTFKLRQDGKWSNGDPVKASDFEFAWKRVVDPQTASNKAFELAVIKNAESITEGDTPVEDLGVKALDDFTLEVTLERPTPYFIELAARTGTMLPVHPATVEADETGWSTKGHEDYVSNGPFTVDEISLGSHYTLIKNEHYWDKNQVSLDGIHIAIIESEQTANTAFQSGDLDFIGIPFNTVSLDAIDTYEQQGLLGGIDIAANYNIKMNITDELLSNVNLRKALVHGVDRQGLIDNVTKAEETPAMSLVPPTIKGFENVEPYFEDRDFETAKEYLNKALEELGMKDPSEIQLKLSFNTNEAHAAIAQHLQQGWNENLGIQVELDNTEWQVHLDRMTMLDYQLGRIGNTADYNDPYSILEMYYAKEVGTNRTGYEDPEYQQLIDAAQNEQDEEKRMELLRKAEAHVMDAAPFVPLYFYKNLYATQPNVKNITPDPFTDTQLKYVEIVE